MVAAEALLLFLEPWPLLRERAVNVADAVDTHAAAEAMFAKVLGQARHVIKDGAVPKGHVQPVKEKEVKVPIKAKPVVPKTPKAAKTTKDTPLVKPVAHEKPAPIPADIARQAQLELARKNLQNVPHVAPQVHLMQSEQAASEVRVQQLEEKMAVERAAAVADVKAAATEATKDALGSVLQEFVRLRGEVESHRGDKEWLRVFFGVLDGTVGTQVGCADECCGGECCGGEGEECVPEADVCDVGVDVNVVG